MIQQRLFGDHAQYVERKGWIYIFGENPNVGRYKVGKTENHPLERFAELSTGHVGLTIVGYWPSDDMNSDERFLHAWMSRWRINPISRNNRAREWFWLQRAMPVMQSRWYDALSASIVSKSAYVVWFERIAFALGAFLDRIPVGWESHGAALHHGVMQTTIARDQNGFWWRREVGDTMWTSIGAGKRAQGIRQ